MQIMKTSGKHRLRLAIALALTTGMGQALAAEICVEGDTNINTCTGPDSVNPAFNTITATNIILNPGTIDGTEIADNSIGLTEMQDDSVGSDEIIDDSITTDDIMDETITGDDIMDGSITSDDIGTLETLEVVNPNGPMLSIDDTDVVIGRDDGTDSAMTTYDMNGAMTTVTDGTDTSAFSQTATSASMMVTNGGTAVTKGLSIDVDGAGVTTTLTGGTASTEIVMDDDVAITATTGAITLDANTTVAITGGTGASMTATTGPADLTALAGAASVTATGGDATLESTDAMANVTGNTGANVTTTTGNVEIEAIAGDANVTGDSATLNSHSGSALVSANATDARVTYVGATGATAHGLIVGDTVTTLTGGLSSPSLTLADPDAVLTNDTGHVTLSTTGGGDKDVRVMSTDDVFIDAADIVDITGVTSASLNSSSGVGSSFDAAGGTAMMSSGSGSQVSALSNGDVNASSGAGAGDLTLTSTMSSMTGGTGGPGTTTFTLNDSGAHLDNRLDMGGNQINNLAKGTSKYDAVNKGQLDDVENTSSEGIAAVAAMAAIPGAIPGKRYSVGVGAGYFNSESALAIGGYAQVTDSITVSASAGFTSDETAGGVGASFSW